MAGAIFPTRSAIFPTTTYQHRANYFNTYIRLSAIILIASNLPGCLMVNFRLVLH
jgi:hypothetical protein